MKMSQIHVHDLRWSNEITHMNVIYCTIIKEVTFGSNLSTRRFEPRKRRKAPSKLMRASLLYPLHHLPAAPGTHRESSQFCSPVYTGAPSEGWIQRRISKGPRTHVIWSRGSAWVSYAKRGLRHLLESTSSKVLRAIWLRGMYRVSKRLESSGER